MIIDLFEEICEYYGQCVTILLNHGHPASEVDRYPLSRIDACINELIERRRAENGQQVRQKPSRRPIQDGNMITEPMSRARYLAMMGVQDPKIRKKMM